LTTPFIADKFLASEVPDSNKEKAVRVSVGIGVTVLMLGLLFPVAARAQDDDTKAELEALKKRVAELEKKANESNNPDDSLRKAVERISEPGGLGVKWNNGLWFETDDKAF
jgi:hypothetical protein